VKRSRATRGEVCGGLSPVRGLLLLSGKLLAEHRDLRSFDIRIQIGRSDSIRK